VPEAIKTKENGEILAKCKILKNTHEQVRFRTGGQLSFFVITFVPYINVQVT